MRRCEKCGRPTARRVCGLCKFEAARSVPPEVVEQLKQEAEQREVERQRAAYTVRVRRELPVVIVEYAVTRRVTVIAQPKGGV